MQMLIKTWASESVQKFPDLELAFSTEYPVSEILQKLQEMRQNMQS